MTKNGGFTIIELVLSIGLLFFIFGFSLLGVSQFQRSISVGSADIAVINVLTTASSRARSGVEQSSWGVHLPYDETTRIADELVVFSGDSFATRDTDFDASYPFPKDILFNDVALNGAGVYSGNDHEIIFLPLSGITPDYGYIIVESYGEEHTIDISPEGITVRAF